MSVLAKDRSLSKLEFYMHARKLQLQMLHLMAREPSFYTRSMEKADRETLQAILSRYNIEKIVEDYPVWMIWMFRKRVMDHLQYMMDGITRAYTIWATNIAEANDRRLSQDHAIAACEMLKQDIELMADVLPIKADKLLRYIDSVNREIALLKGWRKSDNRKNKALK